MSRLFRLSETQKRDPAIDAWMRRQIERASDLGRIAQTWFDVIRGCGDDVRESVHDDAPTFIFVKGSTLRAIISRFQN